MKFSTGSSSSSLASDSLSRKSTLCIYTEVDSPAPLSHCERMDSSSEAMELRRELDAVKSALQQQSESVLKQKHQLVEANQALAVREKRASHERRLRQDQLASVLRSLVLLESSLTREQKKIRLALHQKEKIVKSQQEEITKLKARKSYCSNCQQLLGFTSEQTNIETDPEFQSLESTDSRFQNTFVRSCSYRERNSPPVFQKNTRLSKSFQLPKHDVVYGNTSSSEEGNNVSASSKSTFVKNKQAFVRRDVFRRSRKYSGRKNKYTDNSQKGYNNQANNSSSAEECMGMSYQVNHDDADATANQIAKDIRRASLKIDQLIGEATKRDQENTASDSDKTYSSKMERMHGIKRQASDEIKANRQIFLNNVLNEEGNEKPWYCNVSDPEQDTDCLDQRISLSSTKSKSAEDLLTTGYNSDTIHVEVVSAKNEVLCNNILENIGNNDRFNSRFDDKNNNVELNLTKQAATAEINENWYSFNSDVDDSPTREIYKNNPVLECVNQILLQNSLDDSSNDNSKSSEAPSPKSSTKRVQFSTLNSISCEDNNKVRFNITNNHTLPRSDKRANKIVKFSLETASEHSYEVPNTAQGFQYEIQSIYSNEYEPIITKTTETKPVPLPRSVQSNDKVQNIRGSLVKNIAANIESRSNNLERKVDNDLGSMKIFNKRKVPRTPPALPPKPKNLSAKWKAENTVKPTTEPLDSEAVAANQRVADVKMRKVGQVATINNIEPDYCSISEINVPVVSNCKRELLLTQPTVEIHNEQYAVHAISQKNSVAKVVSLPRIQNKISDKDIPKLPQVTEIIIPDEDDKPNEENNRSFHPTTDSYLTNFKLHPLQPKLDPRASIQMGNTVSSILSEINKGGRSGSKQINLTDLDHQFNHVEKAQVNNAELHKAEYFDDIDKFDLSQNFEEFKIDDELGSIVAEEYRISSGSSDGSMSDIVTEHIITIVPDKDQHNINSNDKGKSETFLEKNNESALNKGLSKNAKLFNKPDLLSNIENLETESVRNSDIESSNSSGSNSGSYNTVKCEPRMIINAEMNATTPKGSFDFFLDASGLSSKSIITPSKNYLAMRPPSANHKSVLKPKDIKMRVRNPIATNKINEKPMTTAIKYFEPYL